MSESRALRALGFGQRDRVVILHADDVGMCSGSAAAFEELALEGSVSSGSVMVPCPEFSEAAALCRRRPELDAGVHLTLTSGSDIIRWGPISTQPPSSGLVQHDGTFYRLPLDVCAHADHGTVYLEMRAQLDRALAEGIDVTHIDSHMFCGLHLPFLDGYLRLSQERGLPCLTWDIDPPEWSFPHEMAAAINRRIQDHADHGLIVPVDKVGAVTWRYPEERLERLKHALTNLEPGVCHFIVHPSKDTPELRAMGPRWQSRVADYEACRGTALRDHMRSLGIHLIGYRALRDAVRRSAVA